MIIDDHRCVFCFTDLYSNWYFGRQVWHILSHGAEPAKDASYHFSSAHGGVGNWVPMGGANPVLHFMEIQWESDETRQIDIILWLNHVDMVGHGNFMANQINGNGEK